MDSSPDNDCPVCACAEIISGKWTLLVIRDLAVVSLMILVVRQIYRPQSDLVRWRGRLDDPGGGVFDRAPDAFPSRFPNWLRPRPTASPREPAVEHPPVEHPPVVRFR